MVQGDTNFRKTSCRSSSRQIQEYFCSRPRPFIDVQGRSWARCSQGERGYEDEGVGIGVVFELEVRDGGSGDGGFGWEADD